MKGGVGTGLRGRLTFANVVSAIALFVSLATGGAYAANTVFSSDIVDGQVKTADLGDAAVVTVKIAGGAVTTDKVADETLRSRDVLDNSLKGADIDESTLSNIGGGGPAGGDLTGTYPNPVIRTGVIGARHLKGLVEVSDSELIQPGGVADDVRAQCPDGYLAIHGGGYWQFPSGQLSGIRNYGAGIVVDGTNRGTAEQYLHAFAYCLPY